MKIIRHVLKTGWHPLSWVQSKACPKLLRKVGRSTEGSYQPCCPSAICAHRWRWEERKAPPCSQRMGWTSSPKWKELSPAQSSIHKCSSMKSDSHPSPLRICYFNGAQDVRIFANTSTAVKISSLDRIPDRHMFYPCQNGQTLQRNIQRGKRFHIVTAISRDCSQPDNWDAGF